MGVVHISHLGKGDGLDSLARVAPRGGVALNAGLWPQGVQVDPHDALDGVDGGNALAASVKRGACRRGDVGDVGRHLCPHGLGSHLVHPACRVRKQLTVLAHGHAHLALGHAVRAAKVDLKCVHASGFAQANQLLPRVFVVLLHDGGDEHAPWKLLLEALELVQHDRQGAVADELNVFPPNDLLAVGRLELGIARGDVDHLRADVRHRCDVRVMSYVPWRSRGRQSWR